MKQIKLMIACGLFLASCTSTNKVAETNFEGDRNIAQAPASEKKKYFMVQNIASERTRIYEKCGFEPERVVNGDYANAPANCAHKLVFQTNNVVGRDSAEDMKTDLGVQFINNWHKFYETPGVYPAYYKAGYPDVPSGGFGQWTKSKAMPNRKGEMRGAFGWYAATMEPQSNGQWTHGTVGRGSDGGDFIRKAHKSIATIFTDLRSHGCVRHENRAVAYMQSILPEGSTLVKIYAKEDLADKSLSSYQGQRSTLRWDWILTKEQSGQTNPYTSTASEVQKRLDSGKISQSDVLERGSYEVDRYPVAQEWRPGKRAKGGNSGDSYDIGDGVQGTFYVDEGRAANYVHPRTLGLDGLSDFRNYNGQNLPAYMIKN